MRFHHMCLIVSDLEKAVRMWTVLLGFKVEQEFVAPDRDGTDLSKIMEDIWGMKGTKTKMALLSSPEGAMIELQQALDPPVRKTPQDTLNYYHTGIRELALQVDDIEYWWDKVRKAGYETQTPYFWPGGSTARTFLFYDDDRNLIQLWEERGSNEGRWVQ